MADCNSCPSGSTCSKDKSSCMIENNPMNNVKNIIGVMSGKGGVGKSTVSSLITKELRGMGFRVGILDADITGPSIPRLMGVEKTRAVATQTSIIPVETKEGIKVMSLNLLIDEENTPVIWRGPAIAGTVKQFWTDVLWEELDYLIIDMPPGTGDVPLTVMQSIPLDGVVMVSVPQDMVSMIVAKAVNMSRQMNVDVLGVIQNMSYIECDECKEKISLFDGEKSKAYFQDMNVKLLGELPMTRSIGALSSEDSTDSYLEAREIFSPIVKNIIDNIKK